jgi:hypothetical protein
VPGAAELAACELLDDELLDDELLDELEELLPQPASGSMTSSGVRSVTRRIGP